MSESAEDRHTRELAEAVAAAEAAEAELRAFKAGHVSRAAADYALRQLEARGETIRQGVEARIRERVEGVFDDDERERIVAEEMASGLSALKELERETRAPTLLEDEHAIDSLIEHRESERA